jgi:hypothetical protein
MPVNSFIARLLGASSDSESAGVLLVSKTDTSWNGLIKRTVARFSRGSISAQRARILLPEEQEREHKRAVAIARQWKRRAPSGT